MAGLKGRKEAVRGADGMWKPGWLSVAAGPSWTADLVADTLACIPERQRECFYRITGKRIEPRRLPEANRFVGQKRLKILRPGLREYQRLRKVALAVAVA